MRPAARVGLIVAGYAAAIVVAALVTRIYAAWSNLPDAQASGGMAAFGDSLLFLAVFGLAAIPATGAALHFLRTRPGFWVALSIAALVIAASSLAAFLVYVGPRFSHQETVGLWSGVAVLRILVAPLCALVFFLGGFFAPTRRARLSLLAAAAVEIAVFAFVVVGWIFSPR